MGKHSERFKNHKKVVVFKKNQGPPRVAPSPVALDKLLKASHINLPQSQLEQLWRYHNLLRARNQDRDLTRIVGFEPMVTKHYIDCMIVGDMFELPSPLADVGSGAGFPGIPLKIRYPHLKMTLAEPRPRRVNFLNEVIRDLKLPNIEVFGHKVVSRSFTYPVKGVITRALETIDKTILRTSGCVEPGTQLIFMKGPASEQEIKDALKTFGKWFRPVFNQAYTLPHTNHQRRLVVFECVEKLPEKLGREED